VTKEPNLYRCAAAWAPVTDLMDLRNGVGNSFIAGTMDELGDDRERLVAASPERHVDQIKVPLMLMHGKEDFTVDYRHTEKMERALRGAGKQVEVVYLEKADHYRRDADARTAWLSALDRFLSAQLGTP
jgi:dipeptidyl aminopeptidase/acylaminoacyl peptidase